MNIIIFAWLQVLPVERSIPDFPSKRRVTQEEGTEAGIDAQINGDIVLQ